MKTLLLAMIMCVVVEGCAASERSTAKYSVVLTNGTSNAINRAHVRYGKFESVGGYLGPRIEKIDVFVSYPMPDKATVVWVSGDGKAHEKEVEVAKILPKNFSGEIVFTIQEDGSVLVTHRPFFEMPKTWKVQPKQ
ncbi:MAG: hypothetical protein HZA89_15895 [Verrucomicrobia bacterium]|nr:hypothetical protein [Verrucomicrobiota bacterium]